MLHLVPFVTGLLAATGSAGLADRGVFPELDARVAIALPAWVPTADLRFVVDRPRRLLTVLAGREPIKTYPMDPKCDEPTLDCLGLRPLDRGELASLAAGRLPLAEVVMRDSDGDGIPDPVDILLGAKKAVQLASAYVETSPRLAYPGGDVPTSEGVCSDVVVRALRNAGIDLQKETLVEHNRDPVHPGAGSCIFIHPWVTPGVPSPGCTMLPHAPVERLLRWLDPAAHPLLVQLPRAAFRAVAKSWALPAENP